MPYSKDKPESLPEPVKKYSKHEQHIWVSAFNNALQEYGDEKRAFATAYSSVNKFRGKETDETDNLENYDPELSIKSPFGKVKISFVVGGDGAKSIERLLRYFERCGQAGHSTCLKVDSPIDDEEKEMKFGFDGDGADHIEHLKVEPYEDEKLSSMIKSFTDVYQRKTEDEIIRKTFGDEVEICEK